MLKKGDCVKIDMPASHGSYNWSRGIIVSDPDDEWLVTARVLIDGKVVVIHWRYLEKIAPQKNGDLKNENPNN